MSVFDVNGAAVSEVELPADIFEQEINVGLMHQAFIRQLANLRRGTHSTKTRSEVNISHIKIYKQKGTGRARHGSRNAPIFVGGGQAHGPKPRSYRQAMPRKMRRQAIRCALSVLVRDQQLVMLSEWNIKEGKTKEVAQVLQAIAGTDDALILLTRDMKDGAVYRAAHNLPNVTVLNVEYLNIRDLLNHKKVVMPLAALDVVKQIWGKTPKGVTANG
ncbi:MAG: 50S ribosomal protein L4 [Phototrophicaceae bacterium]